MHVIFLLREVIYASGMMAHIGSHISTTRSIGLNVHLICTLLSQHPCHQGTRLDWDGDKSPLLGMGSGAGLGWEGHVATFCLQGLLGGRDSMG